MNMVPSSRAVAVHIAVFVCLLSISNFINGLQSDIDCLRAIKDTLEDPFGYVYPTWNFSDHYERFICTFKGIDCWHPDENRVLNIRLSYKVLKGEFPRGIENCSALTGLDLSGNMLYGDIPNNISNIIPVVTTLDLCSNNFSGEIPKSLANCTYLNALRLDNNQLTGQIPAELGLLLRIQISNVAGNHLTGPVPNFGNASTSIPPNSYANNAGLCGGPLPACPGPPRKTHNGDSRILSYIKRTIM
ncbi:hypothetical protein F0562_002198 [Nyssa sinensis]|uniref:Leucine-rich repeat-containing N-terminal plant-type domain-containing protein n=1 Tax=Nyssa sinensis TaxID=561372 RepID=A0A5J5C6Q4_9ASTE|nr:hypothetical protein F0562_002198 [Nyssa sinensis]